MKDIQDKLQNIKDNNLYRTMRYLSKPQDKYTTIMKDIQDKLQNIKDNNLYRTMRYLSKPQDKYTTIDNKDVLLMSSNNYLGLCNNEQVKLAAIDAINKYGLGSGGSRLTTGSYDLHRELEKKLANLKKN